jgi:hypothetical protein
LRQWARDSASGPLFHGSILLQDRPAGRASDKLSRETFIGEELSMTKKLFLLTSAVAALSLVLANAPALAGDTVGLITKTNTNPFFVKMKQGFEAKAKELGLAPQAYAGKYDGDNDGQVAAIGTPAPRAFCSCLAIRRRSSRRSRRRARPAFW